MYNPINVLTCLPVDYTTTAGDNNDVFVTSSMIRVITSNSGDAITGFATGINNRGVFLTIINSPTSAHDLLIKHNSSASASGNRINIFNSTNITLAPKYALSFIYSTALAAWMPVSSPNITSGGDVPAGGTTGQALTKASGTDFDTVWTTLGGGSGTVTSVSTGNLSPLFSASIANASTVPALSFTLSSAAANSYLGNATGSTAAPSYTTAGSLTKVDDTNVTLTLGGNPTTSLLRSTSLTLGWVGSLSTARGGTGLSSIGSANQILSVNSLGTALTYVNPAISISALGDAVSDKTVLMNNFGQTLFWNDRAQDALTLSSLSTTRTNGSAVVRVLSSGHLDTNTITYGMVIRNSILSGGTNIGLQLQAVSGAIGNIALDIASGSLRYTGNGEFQEGRVLTSDDLGVATWRDPVGTVSSGIANRLAYYAVDGTALTSWNAIAANRALLSDANGLPIHATTTDVEIGYVNGVTSSIQTQLNNKQPLDSDLTSIAALTPANDDIIQRKAGVWTNRTIAQHKADLAINNVENTALSTWPGTANIVTVGTVTTGTWNATAISIAKGGAPTGGTTGQALVKNSNTNYDYSWTTLGGTGANALGTYIVQTGVNAPANAQILASLATGIVKNTTVTGVLSIATGSDFPILNQNTTGSAALLTTARSIYGNLFNGTTDLTQIIASTFGGTGNGFTKFSGPTTAEKTFTLPNASATILTDNALVTAAQGGTGNGFTQIMGPSGTVKNFTLPNTSATILTDAATVTAIQGGTGQSSYTIGDLLQASSSTVLSKLAAVATGNVLISGGVGTISSWGKVGLTTHVSGILPGANGGTNNGFMAFSGPASTLKTFTLPNASATILTDNAAVTIAQGGTGQVTANAALNALLPTQTGNSGKVLITDGVNANWNTVTGVGTVTSFAFTNGSGFTGSVSNATTTPTLSLTTSVTDTQVMVSSSGAISGSANLTFNASKQLQIGGTTNFMAFQGGGTSAAGLYFSTANPTAGASAFSLNFNSNTVVEAGSGTHTILGGVQLNPITVTPGAATVTNTATLAIVGAASATVTGTNYSLWSQGGANRFDGFTTFNGGVDFGGQTITNYSPSYNTQSGTTYTIQASDMGKVIVFTGASPSTFSIPASLPQGFSCVVIQSPTTSAQVTFAASGGSTVSNVDTLTKTKGPGAMASIIWVASNTFITGGQMA